MRRTRLLTLPLLAVLPTLPACNDGTSGDGPTVAATPAEVHDFCDAQCARSARCGTTEPAVADAGDSCADGCVTELGSLGSNLRADVVRELAACQASLPCGPMSGGVEGTTSTFSWTLQAPRGVTAQVRPSRGASESVTLPRAGDRRPTPPGR